MKLVLRSIFALSVLSALAFLTGCASTTADTDPSGQAPTSMPWNKPESWEGTGALGGAMGQ